MKTYKAILLNVENIGYSKPKNNSKGGQYKLFFTESGGELGKNNKNNRFAINTVNGDILFTAGGKAEKAMRKIYGDKVFDKQLQYPLIKNNEIM